MTWRSPLLVACVALASSVSCATEVTIHLLGDGASSDAGAPGDSATEEMHVRADQALSGLMLKYWGTIASNTTTFDSAYDIYWDALFDAADRRGPSAFAGTAKMFFELQGRRKWLGADYEDEVWVVLALLHGFRVTNDATYLDQAKAVYADIMTAWDSTCCGADPGGLWSKRAAPSGGPEVNPAAGRDKSAAANAGAVIGGARIYEATRDPTYLAFARQVFDYWSSHMVEAATGHVFDHIQSDGTIDRLSHTTENEGLFIGAVVALARASGDSSHLALAHQVARYMMSTESVVTPLGTILSDGNCSGSAEMYKASGARYLGELYAEDTSHTEYRDFLHRSADAAWTLALDLSSGDISCDWAGPYDSKTGGLDSLGAIAIALAAAAEALGPAVQRPPLQYEAEEANLHGVGVGNDKPGFAGWGYVVGWGSDGQSIDFLIIAPSSAQYDLNMRYAAGNNATRVVRVNGSVVDPAFAFPSTGGYETYATVSGKFALNAGPNVVSLEFANAQASAGFLNFDQMQLTLP